MKGELKPCPFCQGTNITTPPHEDACVYCKTCGARAVNLTAWNTRSLIPGGELPDDVRRLVIAAREFWDIHDSPTEPEARELDQALEAFASRVPFADEPQP